MIRNSFIICIAVVFIGFGSLFIGSSFRNKRVESSNTLNHEEVQELSDLIGNALWHTLQNYSPHYDLEAVLTRIKYLEANSNKLEPREIGILRIAELLNKGMLLESQHNVEYAQKYLSELAMKEGVREIVQGKVYYEVLKEGDHDPSQRDFPTLEYIEYIMTAKKFKETRRSKKPFKICLSETIKGFSMGVQGMKVGERRKIYIHPEYAHGVVGRESPHELYIYEVLITEI